MQEKNWNDSYWCYNKLRESDHRLTVSRKAMLDVLSNSHDHPSAEEIYLAVHKVHPNIGVSLRYIGHLTCSFKLD